MHGVPLSDHSERGTLYNFVTPINDVSMEIFIAAIIITISLFLATFQLMRNRRYRELSEPRQKVSTVLFYMNALLISVDMSAGGSSALLRFVFDETIILIPLSVMSSSLWTRERGVKAGKLGIAVQSVMIVYYSGVLLGFWSSPPSGLVFWGVSAMMVLYPLLFFVGIWYRIREVREVMHSGTVWAALTLTVEVVYLIFVLIESIGLVAYENIGVGRTYVWGLFAVVFTLNVAAIGLRIACDSLFLMMRRHERTIIESMKISPVELAGLGQREDDIYKDVYNRVVEYFDREKPFLNGDLTINDVVTVVFTNKLYISRAISQYTGRNFCQFVNYHRVMYSVDCFRANPDLKVTELWQMCGFNTIVSYNMAFRLFMGENPSDWCRKEKGRIFRRKK